MLTRSCSVNSDALSFACFGILSYAHAIRILFVDDMSCIEETQLPTQYFSLIYLAPSPFPLYRLLFLLKYKCE